MNRRRRACWALHFACKIINDRVFCELRKKKARNRDPSACKTNTINPETPTRSKNGGEQKATRWWRWRLVNPPPDATSSRLKHAKNAHALLYEYQFSNTRNNLDTSRVRIPCRVDLECGLSRSIVSKVKDLWQELDRLTEIECVRGPREDTVHFLVARVWSIEKLKM